MATEVTNDIDLQRAILGEFKKVVDYVLKKLSEKLEQYIQEDTYSAYSPTWYVRTDNFLNSVEVKNSTINNSNAEGEVGINDSASGAWWRYEEINSQTFLEIMNGDRAVGAILGFPTESELGRKPFWSDFEKYVNENLDNLFKQGCVANGIEIEDYYSIFS